MLEKLAQTLKNRNPSTIILYTAFIYVGLLFLIFGAISYKSVDRLDESSDKYTKNAVEHIVKLKQEELKTDVETQAALLNRSYEQRLREAKNTIKTRVQNISALLLKLRANGLSLTMQSAQDVLSSFSWGDDKYYFIVDQNGCILIHPEPKLQGRCIDDFSSDSMEYGVLSIIKNITEEKREGFFSAPFYMPSSGEISEKIYYGKYIDELKIFIGIGEYLNRLALYSKNDFLDSIRQNDDDSSIIAIFEKSQNLTPVSIRQKSELPANHTLLEKAKKEISIAMKNGELSGSIGSINSEFIGYFSIEQGLVVAKISHLEALKKEIEEKTLEIKDGSKSELYVVVEIFAILLFVTALLSLGIGSFIQKIFELNNNKLKRNNRFLHMLMNNIDDLIIVTDRAGNIIDVNSATESYEQKDRTNIVSKNIKETERLSSFMDIVTPKVEWSADEKKRCLYCKKISIDDKDMPFELIFCKDITEIKEQEDLLKKQNIDLVSLNKRLSEKNKELTDIFDNSPNPIAIIDKNCFAEYVNRAFRRIFDIQTAGIESINVNSLVRKEFRKLFASKVNRAEASGYAEEFDMIMSSPAKGTMNVKISITKFSQSLTFVLNIRDTSAEVEHTQNLEEIVRLEIEKREENELKFSTIFQTAPAGVVVISDEPKLIEYNNSFANMGGFTQEELENIDIRELFDENENLNLKRLLKEKEDITSPVEIVMKSKNRDKITVNMLSKTLKLKEKTYKIAIFSDISELIKAREKEKESEKLLIQQSRFAVMGEMLNMIAHQWRQPLGALSIEIMNLMDRLEEGYDKAYVRAWEMKSASIIKHLSSTIDEFRTFFKQDKEMEYFDIQFACQKSIGLIEPILQQKKITVELELNAEGRFYGYHNRLQQALLNILNNAKDALESLDEGIDKKITFSSSISEGRLKIVIKDNAGGIDIEPIEKIFEPYFSTKNKNSSGIGLYMTKVIIVDQMNGFIKAYNDAEGAVFEIELPIIEKEVEVGSNR